MIPATIASIASYFVLVSVRGSEAIFPTASNTPVTLSLIENSFIIGLLSALTGALFVWLFAMTTKASRRITSDSSLPKWLLPLLAGVVIGTIGLFAPQVLGIGYPTISPLSSGAYTWPLTFVITLLILKMVATCLTLRMGGSGGLFIPTVFIGAALGAIYVAFLPGAASQALVMAATGAMIASTNKTLLTSVAFVAETSGPASIIPTLVAAAISYFVSYNISFYSDIQPTDELEEEQTMMGIIYHQIENRREIPALKAIKAKTIMEPVISIKEETTIKEARDLVKSYSHREYPVVDDENRVIGTITLEDLLIQPDKSLSLNVGSLPLRTSQLATLDTDLYELAPVLMESDLDNIWIVNSLQEMKLLGVVNETDVLKTMLTLIWGRFRIIILPTLSLP